MTQPPEDNNSEPSVNRLNCIGCMIILGAFGSAVFILLAHTPAGH